jgi:hypothetical protein
MKLTTSYFGCRILRHVKRDMQRLDRLGFARVVHTFSENDLFYFPETMRDIVSASHDAGLEVQLDPWGVGGIFGGEAFSRWILDEPDLMQRGASGRPLGAACLNHPRVQELVREWTLAAARTGADWIFWDEPHWSFKGPRNPAGEYCVCEHCRRVARAQAEAPGSSLPIGDDLACAPRAAVDRFRALSVIYLLGGLTRFAADQGLKSSICVLPHGTMDQPSISWAELASLPGVGEFGTDPYWQAFGFTRPDERDRFIDENARAAKAAAKQAGSETMLWIQAFRVPAAGEDDLLEGAERLVGHAPDAVAIWAFEACAHMSALACENPRRIWRRLVNLLGRELGR